MPYGTKDAYFGRPREGFQNSVWVELIGFDCEKEDYGVHDYLSALGFLPHCISLHLTSVDFFNTYAGFAQELPLPRYACSYGGHARNDERARQPWTNLQLRGLIAALHAQGIKVYGSFFDMDSENGLPGIPLFSEQHPELLVNGSTGSRMERGIVMIKRFADGSFYEDYLLQQLCKAAGGYGFDGYQLADGISSPRGNIWYGDFSDDLLEQAQIVLPDGVLSRRDWIWDNRRTQWLRFYTKRWGAFLEKLVSGLRAHGLETAVNSAWTRDPLEARFRYGADYRIPALAGATSLVPEDVSSDLAILGTEDCHGYEMPYAHRRLVHHEFLANLMALRAYVPSMMLTPLFMIWDNQEQWDVLHHAPTAMQRAAACNFCNFLVTANGLRPITNGPHFCLGDALTAEEWAFIRLCIDSGYTEHTQAVEGAAFLWSDARLERELDGVLTSGLCHSAHWLALLLNAGAALHQIVRVEDLDAYQGDLFVSNLSLLPEKEREQLRSWRGGAVIEAEIPGDPHFARHPNPAQDGWPFPLTLREPERLILDTLTERINEGCNLRIEAGEGKSACGVAEVRTGRYTARVFVDNNEYHYVVPRLFSRRAIASVRAITKPEGYDVHLSAHSFQIRVPGRGIDILEITYAEDKTGARG